MRLADFRRLVERMAREIPAEYLEGVAGVDVSPKTVPHATREGVYTLGECVPIDVGSDPTPSRLFLYHGSFRELARARPDFDWRAEAWETLTHELRHHLEWKARAQDLEEYDWAAEQSFARLDEEAFDPLFFLAGERIAPDVYRVDDDVFFDRVVRRLPARTEVEWRGRRYRVAVPPDRLPLYLVLIGLNDPPVGEAVVVLRRRPGLLDFFRSTRAPVERVVHVQPGA